MGVTTYTHELHCQISVARMFKAIIIDSNSLIPKLLPQFIKSVDLVQGDGGKGSIEQVNFTEATPYRYVKHRIDELDKENYVCKYTMFEGEPLGEKMECIVNEVKFEDGGDGGCVCKMTISYHAIGGCEIKEEEIKDGKEQSIGIYKVVEAYLLENPIAYA